MILKKIVLITLYAALLSACNFLSKDEPIKVEVYDIGQMEQGCKIRTDRLHLFLKEKITGDLDCLEKSMQQYVDFVQRDLPDAIKLEEIEKFTKTFFPNDAQMAQRVLVIIFEINGLLHSDNVASIKISNIPKVFNLARTVNNHGPVLNKLIAKLDRETYLENRQKIEEEIALFAKDLLDLIYDKPSLDVKYLSLSIINILEKIKIAFSIPDNQLDLSLVSKFLFIKRIFVGGEDASLSKEEFIKLLKKSVTLAISALDLGLGDFKNISTNQEEQKRMITALKNISKEMIAFAPETVLFNHNNVMDVVKEIFGKKYEVFKFEEAIIHLKENIIGGSASHYTINEVKWVFGKVRDLVEYLYFTNLTYNYFKPELESSGPVSDFIMPRLQEYDFFEEGQHFKFWDSFKYITKNFRFFVDPTGRQAYGNNYQRSEQGFARIAAMRWGFHELLEVYGHLSSKEQFKKVMVRSELSKMLYQYKDLLLEIKFLPKDIERTINEVNLGADLFQINSNGNGELDEDELTEYISLIMAANSIGKDLGLNLKKYCIEYVEPELGYDVDCYREYFYQSLFDDLGIQKYFQKLYSYRQDNQKDSESHFLNLEGNARIIDDEKLPMTQTDLNRLMTSFSQIETVIVRFDKNKDNMLNNNELEESLELFLPTIMELAGIKETQVGLGRSIFYFLIKNKKIPSKMELIKFHLLGRKKNITASRYTIGAVLAQVVRKK